jgi:hypothetical protein
MEYNFNKEEYELQEGDFVGFIVGSVDDYESKQNDLVVEDGKRYAGRVVNGEIKPDVIIFNGEFFIPHPEGVDLINILDVKVIPPEDL